MKYAKVSPSEEYELDVVKKTGKDDGDDKDDDDDGTGIISKAIGNYFC